MRADVVQKIDRAIQAMQEVRELAPEVLSSPERHELFKVARSLDEHIDNGVPYDLTFFYDKQVPLTPEQKKIITAYLAHAFHDIWGKTWIKGDAQRIRDIVNGCIDREEQ